MQLLFLEVDQQVNQLIKRSVTCDDIGLAISSNAQSYIVIGVKGRPKISCWQRRNDKDWKMVARQEASVSTAHDGE